VQNYATQSRAVPAAALCFESAKVIIALEVGVFPAPPQFPPGGFGLSPSHSPSACHVRIALSRAAFRTAFFAFWKLSVLYDERERRDELLGSKFSGSGADLECSLCDKTGEGRELMPKRGCVCAVFIPGPIFSNTHGCSRRRLTTLFSILEANRSIDWEQRVGPYFIVAGCGE
jgi:hypothetical protein